jgi:alpha-ketoglutarate-dependent taurine dioxygenase
MSESITGKPMLKKLGEVRGRRVSVASGELVESAPLRSEGVLPLRVSPVVAGVDLVQWCASHREWIGRELLAHGGLLFRGFAIGSPAELERLVAALSGDLLEYSYRSTPRSDVEGRIYTSTEYPADQSIPMHNEMSYSRSWPMKIWFLCAQPAADGGETPIADSRGVYARIDPEVREAFARQGVMYVRNYGGGLDLPWQEVFQTGDREEVEGYCATAGIELEWRGGDRLRTRQVCQAVAVHPATGEPVWFNQAHLFHVSSLAPGVRELLLSSVPEDELPRNAYFGDGSPIPAAILDRISAAYDAESVVFPWQAGDILLLDNMLTAHGRRPFSGPRKVLVGMAEPAGGDDV